MELEIIGEGRTTKVYRDGDKAIKLYVNTSPSVPTDEAKKQTFAVDAGLPVPKVYGVTESKEGVALEMEYIAGQVLLRPQMDRLKRHEVFEKLVQLQCMVHKASGEGLPKQSELLKWKIENNRYLDNSLIPKLLKHLETLDCGKAQLCHGDLHPFNILQQDENYWIIDWVDAVCGDPLADACRTYLLLKQHLTRMSGVYLRLFCKEARVTKEDVLAWLPVIAAARLRENLNDQERAFILDLVGSSQFLE
jgi:aminoglycoside phosphotransferase (APT) family kinase protein